MTSSTNIMTSKSLFQKLLAYEKPTVTKFAGIIKIAKMFVKKNLKTQVKLQEFEVI